MLYLVLLNALSVSVTPCLRVLIRPSSRRVWVCWWECPSVSCLGILTHAPFGILRRRGLTRYWNTTRSVLVHRSICHALASKIPPFHISGVRQRWSALKTNVSVSVSGSLAVRSCVVNFGCRQLRLVQSWRLFRQYWRRFCGNAGIFMCIASTPHQGNAIL